MDGQKKTDDQGRSVERWQTATETDALVARDMADFSPDMLCELSLDGRVLFVNHTVERAFGRTAKSIIGRSFLEFIVPADRERMLALFQKIVETGAEPATQYSVAREDGQEVLMDSRVRTHKPASGVQRIFISGRDITEDSAIRTSENERLHFYRVLTESNRPGAVFSEAGDILFSNRAFQSLLGGIETVSDMLDRVSSKTRNKLDSQWQRVRSRHVTTPVDLKIHQKDSESLWFTATWASHQPLQYAHHTHYHDDQRIYTLHYHSITHQKKIEKALGLISSLNPETTHDYLQKTVSALAQALGFDRIVLAKSSSEQEQEVRIQAGIERSAERDGGFISLEGELLSLQDLPTDAISASGEICIHPMGLQQIMPQLRNHFQNPYDAYAGLPILLDNGEPFAFIAGYREQPIQDLELTRTLLRVFAKRISITENYRRAHITLRKIQSRFDVISKHSSDLVIESDDQFNILYISEACRTLLGFPPKHFAGKRILDIIHSDDVNHVDEALRAACELGTDQPEALFVSRCQHTDGSWKNIEARSIAYTRASGKKRLVVLARDITTHLSAKEALRTRALRVDDASRMEAVGRLAGGIAHDFNNLLTAIIGYSDLVLDQVEPTSVAYGDAQEVLRAAERAGSLTRQLLTFSRREVTTNAPIDLNAILAEIDRMIRRLIPKNIKVVTRLSGELFPIMADQGQIEQVLINLVINGCDAMMPGGQLTIETRNIRSAKHLQLRSGPLAPGDYTILTVRDTGTGMDSPTLEQIFEPFFTTKGKQSGTGLGLATVSEIVTEHGGQIDVESEPGQGTTFSVYFPAAEVQAEVIQRSDDKDHDILAAPGGRETILVVEDADSVRTLLTRTLKHAGYKVLTADSATAALRQCARHEEPIDLLLTDVVLPRNSGADIARRAVALRPGIKVRFMSGFPEETLEQHGITRRETPMLEKPFSVLQALHAVRESLDNDAVEIPDRLDASTPLQT